MASQLMGLSELRASFLKVSADMQTRTARYMVASAGGVIRKEARTLAQSLGLRKTGALINNIVIKREKTPNGIAQYHLGVRHGRNLTKKSAGKLRLRLNKKGRVVYANDPYYWRFLEFGWVPRGPGQMLMGGERRRAEQRAALTSSGKKRAGTPFLGPALANKRAEALAAMSTGLQKHLDKAGK